MANEQRYSSRLYQTNIDTTKVMEDFKTGKIIKQHPRNMSVGFVKVSTI